MSITFYNCNSEPNRIDKSAFLTSIFSVNSYTLLEDSNNHNPSWLLDASNNILNANYAYWSEANRYYYIEVTSITPGLFRVNGSVDALHTYRNGILGSTGIAIRCNEQEPLLTDNGLSLKSNLQWEQRLYPTTLNKNLTNILITTG